MNLKGKTIVLGITGGIAAYKMPNVAHALAKAGANVHVLMTKNATEFITPLVFETLTNNRCIVDTFDRNFQYDVAHVSLANAADLMLIAPATANVIAKLAHGLADDMLTTVTLAARCPKLVAPAMNTHMLENPITQDNLKTLEHYGFTVIPSGSGLLACGDTGSGRLPDEGVLVDYVARELEHEKDMQGMKVVVSAGGTREPMDPVRYLTNHSTGKMGYAVARACMLRGADVTLLASSGCTLPPVPFVKTVPFTTAADLFEAVKANAMDADALVMAAAVADYRPATVAADTAVPRNFQPSCFAGVDPSQKPIFRSVIKPPAIARAVQTTPPIIIAAVMPPVPVSPALTSTRELRISVIKVIPETGLVPTMAIALAATVVNRNAMTKTLRIAMHA